MDYLVFGQVDHVVAVEQHMIDHSLEDRDVRQFGDKESVRKCPLEELD
ncbi:MAG: hypothetical protein WCC94_01815 [Candidatus Bathyarchaeia archaeon]